MYIFFIQDFWTTCAFPENRVALEFCTVLNILFTFRIFNNLHLPWKQSLPLKFFTILNIFFNIQNFYSNSALALKFLAVVNILFTFRSFEQLALALKNRGRPEFTVLNMYFLLFKIFSNLRLPWKARGSGRPPDPPPRTPMTWTINYFYLNLALRRSNYDYIFQKFSRPVEKW